MNEKDFRELSAGHALHALSPDDERALREALAARPEWESQLDADVAAAAVLADGVAEVVPPPRVRSALLAEIATTPQESAPHEAPMPASRPRRSASRLWFALAASVAVVLALSIGGVTLAGIGRSDPAQVALEQIEQAADVGSAAQPVATGGSATAYWSSELGRAVLVTDGVTGLAADETYEMWFVREDGAVSAGTFRTDATGAATAALTGDFRVGDVIAVTVEPDGGSPTGAPTSEPILAITT